MEKGNNFGKMVAFMKDNGQKMLLMESGVLYMLMEMFMKGHGKTIWLREKGYINIKTEQSMTECGAKIYNMVKPKKHGQIRLNIKVFMLWEKDKEKEYLIGKMEVNIKANFSKIR